MKKFLCLICSMMLFMTGCAYEFVSLSRQVRAQDTALLEAENLVVTGTSAAHFGTSLNLSMRSPRTLNPLINQDKSVDRILRLIFEPITEVRENMRPTPNLASRINFAADGMSAVVTLREDVFWSDGIRMTSSDVAFSVGVIRGNLGSEIYRKIIRDISAIEIIDSSNFRVRFSRPQGGMSYALNFPVIPRHHYEGHINFSSWVNMLPVGNGLFRVESIEPVNRAVLVPNEVSIRGGNRPYIERVYVLMTDDATTDLMAFEQGIINALSTDVTAFGRFSGARAVTTTTYDTNNFVFLGFNLARPLTAQPGIREAVAHALDREHVVESIYLGRGQKAATIINPVSYLFRSDISAQEFNMEEARNILFNIGTTNQEGALSLEVNGGDHRLEFRLLVNEESPERVAIAGHLRDNLELLGMIIHLDIYDFETYLSRLNAGNFDLFLGAFNFDVMPDFKPLFHSNSIGPHSYNNFAFRSEAVDEILGHIDGAGNEEELWSFVSELQEAIATEKPLIPIVFTQRALLTDARIIGDIRPVMNNIFSNVGQWRIEWAN